MIKRNKRGLKLIAGSEIITLIVATVAIAYLISLSFGIVGGQDVDPRDGIPSSIPLQSSESWKIAGVGTEISSPAGRIEGPLVGTQISSLPSSAPYPAPQIKYGGSKEPPSDFSLNDETNGGKDITKQEPTKAETGGLWNSVGNIYGFGEEATWDPVKEEYIPKPGATSMTNGLMMDNLVSSASWGLTAAGITYFAAGFLTDSETTRNAATAAIGAGVLVGRFVGNIAGMGWGLAAGAAVGIAIFLLMNKKEKSETVRFECLPWDAPTGGQYCEQCNKQSILPCSEYQCKSLGQGCELVNAGTDNQECVWINRKDVDPPIVEPWTSVLSPGYKYTPDNTKNPPNRGTFIKSTETKTGCVKAFTPFKFGVTTNEPAKCKIDYVRNSDGKVKPFDEMKFFFGGNSLLLRNHTQILSLPGPSSNGEEITINNDADYELYVSCQDANGNQNEGEFVFQFCVEKGPDTTPAQIVSTNLINGMPVAYNTSSLPLEVYVNEPATCRWDFVDREYKTMANTMKCSSSVFEMNAQMLYKCSTTLTGLKDREENKYYFRCLDQPQAPEVDRNPNLQSYIFTVKGSQPLLITGVSPNETIRDSTNVIKVDLEAETFAGFNEGQSNCYYSTTGATDSFILFFSDLNYNSVAHKQELHLPEGNYKYFLKCIDLGGNSDNTTVQFRVESDNEAPIVTRIYHDEDNKLRVITNEVSECVYGKESCNYLYADGTKMTSSTSDENQHSTDWNINSNYYIKCSDEFGNQPNPNQCSIVARPFANAVSAPAT